MKPIIFSGEMVRAILDGRKTQTRRVIKPQPERPPYPCHFCESGYGESTAPNEYGSVGCTCNEIKNPYGQPGDLLWVREAWNYGANVRPSIDDEYIYRADNIYAGTWKPSIHMPKEAARIWLEITDARVERVQGMSEKDAIAEGIEVDENNHVVRDDGINWGGAVYAFAVLWDNINAKRGYSWASNPWCWSITFERTEK